MSVSFAESDLAALKAPDVLQAYCAHTLGQGSRRGRLIFYPCPFGVHTRPKLETAERDGVGVAMCRACDKGGTVFDVAAAVLGLDARRDFAACVLEVAEKVGYTLLRSDGAGTTRKPSRRGRGTTGRRPCPARMLQASAGRSDDAQPAYLPADDEAAALRAVEYAATRPDVMASHADALGLCPHVLMLHTDIDRAAALGLLGLDARGRLLYVYTRHDDAGRVRVLMVKTRSLPSEVQGGAPRFLCSRGASKQALFGADSAAGAGEVMITEGESDALAARGALWAFWDYMAHNEPDGYPQDMPLPSVVAKPDAGTFRPAWAAALRGKTVTLLQDADDAGEAGTAKSAGILRAAGVHRVYLWAPPAGAKDARAAYDRAHPCNLMEHILCNRKEVQA